MARTITPEAILSFPNLFEPRAMGGGDPKYSCALIFPEGTDLTDLKKAAAAALKEKFGGKAKAIRKTGYWPFRDDPDDVAQKGYPEGCTFINVRTTRKPGLVSIVPDPETGKPMPLTDPEKWYPGAVVRASIEAYGFDTEGNRGVTFGLGNLQWIRDGDRLDGRSAAQDEFEADPDAVADLSDLTDDDVDDVGDGAPESDEDEDDLSDLLD